MQCFSYIIKKFFTIALEKIENLMLKTTVKYHELVVISCKNTKL